MVIVLFDTGDVVGSWRRNDSLRLAIVGRVLPSNGSQCGGAEHCRKGPNLLTMPALYATALRHVQPDAASQGVSL